MMIYEHYNLFEPGKYFPQCHAPYIIEMPNRSLVVSFFAGSREKAKDVGSWLLKKPVAGGSWSEPSLFLKAEKKSMGGAHFFVPPGKAEIWAFYNLMHYKGWSTCNQPKLVYRDGKWHRAGYFRRMIGYNSRGKVLVLDNGDYLFPMHDELLGYKAYFLISSNQGKSWKKHGPVKTPKGCLEPTVVQLKNGRLLCHLRTKEREIYESWSLDRGRTWSKARSTGLPNPDSMTELLVLEDGTVVLVYNHSMKGRTPLNLRYSTDNAKTWSEMKTLEEGDGEFSYPCMILGSDGNVHLVYTFKRVSVGYVKFDQEWLTS
ncbi:MAG: exo-alpha-sialidase [Candidatus Hodarchaeota archaeon]